MAQNITPDLFPAPKTISATQAQAIEANAIAKKLVADQGAWLNFISPTTGDVPLNIMIVAGQGDDSYTVPHTSFPYNNGRNPLLVIKPELVALYVPLGYTVNEAAGVITIEW